MSRATRTMGSKIDALSLRFHLHRLLLLHRHRFLVRRRRVHSRRRRRLLRGGHFGEGEERVGEIGWRCRRVRWRTHRV